MKTLIISTNAFEAHKTTEGLQIVEKNSAYRNYGFLLTIVGSVCATFSFAVAIIPIKKNLVFFLEYSLWYLGLLAAVGGIIYLVISLNLFKPAKLIFNRHNRTLTLRRKVIPFDKIENLRVSKRILFGKTIIKIRFKENGLPSPLILAPILEENNFSEIENFVTDLKKMVELPPY